jgi:hypothetical protein
VIPGFTAVLIGVPTVAGILALVLGLAGRRPSDLSLGGAALTELLLLAQLVIGIVAPFTGNQATGSVPEWFVYVVCALIIPPAAIGWALTERTRWATVVVGVAMLAVAVMVVRMQIIWTVQSA